MKRRVSPALVVVAAALACGGRDEAIEPVPGEPDTIVEGAAPATVRADLDEAFDLPYGRAAVVGPERLTIRFRSLAEESRCPADVQCPTAGNAAAVFGVLGADGGTATITLNTDRDPRAVGVLGHRVRLTGLEPEPETAGAQVDSANYASTLVVARE